MAAMAKLNRIWQCNTISFASTFRLYKSLVTSILHLWLWNMDPACRLWKKDPDFWNQVHEETSWYLLVVLLGAQDQWLGAKQNQLPCGSTGNSSGNCQETETCMVHACCTPQQLLQNHSSKHLEGWVTLWSAEEMLDGQLQRVDIPAHARSAHKGLLQKKTGRGLC